MSRPTAKAQLSLDEPPPEAPEAVRLARASQAWLDKAERRVEELLAVDDNGDPVTRDMDVE
jgi:exonuclease VII small subunit